MSQPSSRASDEFEVVRSMYPDAIIKEQMGEDIENKDNCVASISLSLQPIHAVNLLDKIPPLQVKLLVPHDYLPDDEEEGNSNPLIIQIVDFFHSNRNSWKGSKEATQHLRSIQADLFQSAKELAEELNGCEAIFSVLSSLQEGLDEIDESKIISENDDGITSTNKTNLDEIDITQEARTSAHHVCLVKWHHMLPGRQHTKEAAVWSSLENHTEICFSAVCLGKPSMGVLESRNVDEIHQFLSACGKHGKKALVIREEELECQISQTQRSYKKPNYLQPVGSKKSEKPDTEGLTAIFMQRYGKDWAENAVKELMSN